MRALRLLTVAVLLVLPACNSVKRFGYEGFDRDSWQHPQQVIESLDIEPGARIADLGAGGGYFTFRLADATGPDGVVYAVDVDPGMIEYLRDRAAKDGYRNVEVVAATADDARLPAGIDLLFTCNTYHHIAEQSAYFARVKKTLAPDGRVAIIELRDEGFFASVFGHATGDDVIRRDMEAAGYRLDATHDFLPHQSFLVFRPI